MCFPKQTSKIVQDEQICGSENCRYSHPPPPPPQHMPQNNYPSEKIPASYSYMNFQASDACYSHQPAQSSTNYLSLRKYDSSRAIGITTEPASVSRQTYHYDNSYQPPLEKIAEADKVAWFAVKALASDNVSAAVDYLRKSLELLTNPSAGQ